MDNDDYIGSWIELFKDAARLLTPDKFKIWLIGVGSSGTYEERFRVGKAIMDALSPRLPNAPQHILDDLAMEMREATTRR